MANGETSFAPRRPALVLDSDTVFRMAGFRVIVSERFRWLVVERYGYKRLLQTGQAGSLNGAYQDAWRWLKASRRVGSVSDGR